MAILEGQPQHPLASVTAAEITAASDLIKKNNPKKELVFKVVALQEPPKALVIPYLEAQRKGTALPTPPNRVVFARWYVAGEVDYYEGRVDVTAGKLVDHKILPPEFHSHGEIEELVELSQIGLTLSEYKKELERLKLPAGASVCCEPWPYGSDGDADERRMWQLYYYLGSLDDKPAHPDFNHYSLPLDFSIVVDDATRKAVRVERLPIKFDGTLPDDNTPWKPAPGSQYAPDLIKEKLRDDLKPLQIVQPEGPSFTVDGERVQWQKWDFILGFNYREGPILRDVKYNGRPTFYRLSLSEMNVPYGDPRRPYTRKSAFDLGDLGAGVTASNLRLGCECLGSIAYFDGLISNQAGEPVPKPNAICLHEVDSGIGWIHSNFRNDSTCVVRRRELVMQTILTVANYEYALYWILTTDGEISFEVKATGIMSTVPAWDDVISDFGIMVGPGVFAPSHQHLFVIRMDPAIDGYTGNQVMIEETVPMDKNKKNPWGVGFRHVAKPMEKAGVAEYNPSANRVVKMVNPAKINPVCHKPVSYNFAPMATQMLLAHPESFHWRRAEFAKHPLYFTTYSDDELYAGSEHTNQSRGGHGIEGWAGRGDDLSKGPVVWHTFGLTHHPRCEDWPIMPVETHRFSIKPVNFHEQNPALDMPPSTQEVNKSVLVQTNGHTNSTNGHSDHVSGCCA